MFDCIHFAADIARIRPKTGLFIASLGTYLNVAHVPHIPIIKICKMSHSYLSWIFYLLWEIFLFSNWFICVRKQISIPFKFGPFDGLKNGKFIHLLHASSQLQLAALPKMLNCYFQALLLGLSDGNSQRVTLPEPSRAKAVNLQARVPVKILMTAQKSNWMLHQQALFKYIFEAV